MGYHSNLEIFEYISGVAWRRKVGRGHKKRKSCIESAVWGSSPRKFIFPEIGTNFGNSRHF